MLDTFAAEYNQRRPHRSLEHRSTPAAAYAARPKAAPDTNRSRDTYVRMLVHDLDITIIDATTGEILRDLVLDPTKDYQGTGRPPGPPPRKNNSGPTFP